MRRHHPMPTMIFKVIVVALVAVAVECHDVRPSAPAAQAGEQTNRHHSRRDWIVGFVLGSVVGVIAGWVLLKMLLNFRIMKRTRRQPRSWSQSSSGILIFNKRIRPEQLAFLQEDGLALQTLIGRGGCGTVHKTQLPVEREGDEAIIIAVKKIPKPDGDAPNKNLNDVESRQLDRMSQQVQSEIRTVGQIRHRNVLPLLAYVPCLDHHYLIYEYIKNGSLQDALKAGTEGGAAGMSWPSRLHVAVGVAAGLEYLHADLQPQIIHRDMKPANVLLDDDLEPRIADFGLAVAKAMPDSESHFTASCVVGTIGYLAPEYYEDQTFTAKCDVYSFGVILAALATGKEPFDQFFYGTYGLLTWLRRVVAAGQYAQAIDPDIAGAGYDEQVILLLHIALLCTKHDPKERPTAKEVHSMLSQIKCDSSIPAPESTTKNADGHSDPGIHFPCLTPSPPPAPSPTMSSESDECRGESPVLPPLAAASAAAGLYCIARSPSPTVGPSCWRSCDRISFSDSDESSDESSAASPVAVVGKGKEVAAPTRGRRRRPRRPQQPCGFMADARRPSLPPLRTEAPNCHDPEIGQPNSG